MVNYPIIGFGTQHFLFGLRYDITFNISGPAHCAKVSNISTIYIYLISFMKVGQGNAYFFWLKKCTFAVSQKTCIFQTTFLIANIKKML